MMLLGEMLVSAVALVTGLAGATAFASEPLPWQYKFQPAVTSVMERITKIHQLLLIIITLITVFVLGLLIYTMVKFSAKNNPVPSKTTHNTLIEVLWTVVLVIIAVPSFKLLYLSDVVPKADMTIKAIGNQWYWTYQSMRI
jgi:cytochrome c oxidase subunit 2